MGEDGSSALTRRGVMSLLGATIAGAYATPVRAQTWPDRPVTLVVPFPAGGNTDTMARLLAERLKQKLGGAFVVDNRPNGGGVVAAGQVARATPDGYTFIFASAGQNIIIPMLQKVNYDPEKDLLPVSIFGTGAFILGAKKEAPFNTLPELVAYAKANPGKLDVASAGNGSIGHLSAALLAKRAGIQVVSVPYRGGGPAIAALVAGETDLYFGNASELLQFADSGRIKLIAVSTPEKLPQLPDIPTVASFYPGFSTSSWNGLLAPPGVPKEITDKLVQAVKEAAADPVISSRLTNLGIKPIGNQPAEFADIIAKERVTYREAVDAAGLKMEL
jgi:tripartite-type tricarboxylate transporter receptor subunit TctC